MARAATAKIEARETPSNVFPLRPSEIKIADSSLPPKVKRKKITFVDLFCGAGGFTTGAYRAFKRLGLDVKGAAINHWDVAIGTHSENHPDVQHYCVNIEALRPQDVVPDGKVSILVAGPSCVHFSQARGGKPVSDQMRMSPWHVIRWCTELRVERVIIENVPEIMSWGPIDHRTGRPIKSRKGEFFRAWVQAFEACGYKVEFRVLCCADYGDATTRKRFFLIARSDGKKIRWPQPTHAPAAKAALLGLKPWRTARDVINWSKTGTSIFARPKPLAEKTLNRIEAGLRKFNGALAEPFLVVLRGTGTSRSVDKPLPTITAGGTHLALVQPQLQLIDHSERSPHWPRGIQAVPPVSGSKNDDLSEPRPEPFMIDVNHGETGVSDDRSQSVDNPFGTITTKRGKAIIEPVLTPFILNRHGENGSERVHSVDDPTPTATCRGAGYLVQPVLHPVDDDRCTNPFIVPHFNEREGQAPRTHDIDEPLPTVTSRGAGMLIEPILVQIDQHGGNGSYTRPVSAPLGTIVTKQNMALVEPKIEPADANNIGTGRVVSINGRLYIIDILFRMIDNDELAEASSFNGDSEPYVFTGNAGQVTKQIGNAVPAGTAEALVAAVMAD